MSDFRIVPQSVDSEKVEDAPRSVCVLGLGYIGLPTAAILADHGYRVVGVDVRQDVVETINRGEIHIHEPGLGQLVKKTVERGTLRAFVEPQEADVFFICVPTPINADRSPDLSYVRAAAAAIRPYVRSHNLVILESTSPPRTTEDVVVPEAVPEHLEVGKDVFVAYCPERVLPGQILTEVVANDRIVGGVTLECAARAAQLYESFATGKVHRTTSVNAEMTKLSENAYRDVNIAFANELSVLAERLGADPLEIIRLANCHPRVNILNPGPGVGGHCISVDPWFLVHADPARTELIRTARQVNDSKPDYVVSQIEALVAEHKISTVGCLGLAYKANVDDLRESPSLQIVRELERRGIAEVFVCDPYVRSADFCEFPLRGLDEVLNWSQLVVLLTDHREFTDISPARLRGKHLLDTRGVWRNVLRTPSRVVSPNKAA